MTVSSHVGGADLTSCLVIVTGVAGGDRATGTRLGRAFLAGAAPCSAWRAHGAPRRPASWRPRRASADRGVAVGSLIAGVSAWLLGSMLDLPADLRLSLLPRSVATPFAMTVSSHVGGRRI